MKRNRLVHIVITYSYVTQTRAFPIFHPAEELLQQANTVNPHFERVTVQEAHFFLLDDEELFSCSQLLPGVAVWAVFLSDPERRVISS